MPEIENLSDHPDTTVEPSVGTESVDVDGNIARMAQEIELRSEEVQEIMGFIPHWIIRWGITVIFFVVGLLLAGSFFFKYPDVIYSTVVLTTENPPAVLVARSSGKIGELFVRDKQAVQSGDIIAIIENATNHRHLFELNEKLGELTAFFVDFEGQPVTKFSRNYSLGSLQTAYAGFLKSYADYRNFMSLDYHGKKILSLKLEIERHNLLYRQLEAQARIMGEELKLSRQNFERARSLHDDGIISSRDFETARAMYLQKQYAREGAKTTLSNARIRITQLEQAVLELELNQREEKKKIQLQLGQSFEGLSGQIAQWEQSYLLKAPVSGVVTFTSYWSVNQNVTAGDKVMTIVPEKAGRIIGKVVLPMEGAGKVKVGQRVNIKFANYPYMDYGMVTGVIRSKSLVASDSFYSLEVHLPDGLKTSYGETLEFSQEMQGVAEIITEDVRLLQRVFKPIKAIMDKM